MDLGISGKRALLLCVSSKGLGLSCAEALDEANVNLVINARNQDTLEETAQSLIERKFIAILQPTSQQRLVARVLGSAGHIDILATNAGGPPAGMCKDWTRDDFIAAIDVNILTPISLMQAVLPEMVQQGWGRIVNITSSSIKSSIAQLGLSNRSGGPDGLRLR